MNRRIYDFTLPTLFLTFPLLLWSLLRTKVAGASFPILPRSQKDKHPLIFSREPCAQWTTNSRTYALLALISCATRALRAKNSPTHSVTSIESIPNILGRRSVSVGLSPSDFPPLITSFAVYSEKGIFFFLQWHLFKKLWGEAHGLRTCFFFFEMSERESAEYPDSAVWYLFHRF